MVVCVGGGVVYEVGGVVYEFDYLLVDVY